ncbi:MAG: helix-turn-helix transcriptional regulator [Phycisphaerae bacterium]|nr:helix-turn-helix transcriptional regulator [Phycisphaerae bacterium]
MRIERELMRGAGPTAVMSLLRGRPRYGYELVEALAEQSRGVLDMGQSTLYPMLYNLEAKGLIEGYWQSAPQDAGGRERKYYRLTPRGRRRLEADSAQWRSLLAAMRALGVMDQPEQAGGAA